MLDYFYLNLRVEPKQREKNKHPGVMTLWWLHWYPLWSFLNLSACAWSIQGKRWELVNHFRNIFLDFPIAVFYMLHSSASRRIWKINSKASCFWFFLRKVCLLTYRSWYSSFRFLFACPKWSPATLHSCLSYSHQTREAPCSDTVSWNLTTWGMGGGTRELEGKNYNLKTKWCLVDVFKSVSEYCDLLMWGVNKGDHPACHIIRNYRSSFRQALIPLSSLNIVTKSGYVCLD